MSDAPTRRAAKPFTRWSADTEQAFLLALKLTGQATKAAKTIGRGLSAAYKRRENHPDFARAWHEAVAEGQREWATLAAERREPIDDVSAGGSGRERERIDGWDQKRRSTFLRVLARTKEVREACRAAGISSTAAYNLRGRSPPFARAWEKALAMGVPSVLDAALERAIEGWVEPIVFGGNIIGERRRYSDSLLRALLLRDLQRERLAARTAVAAASVKPKSKKALVEHAYAAAKAAGGYFAARRATEEETNAALMKKLDAVERQMRMDAEDAAEAEAEAAAKARPIGDSRRAPRSLPAVRKC